MKLTEQLKQKDKKITQLESSLTLKGKLIPKDSAYYLTDNEGKTVDGPFCTRCWEVNHLTCKLLAQEIEPFVRCPNCKSNFESKPLFHQLSPDVKEDRQKLIEKTRNLHVERQF